MVKFINKLIKLIFIKNIHNIDMKHTFKINEIFVYQAEFLCAVDHSCMVSSIKWFHATPDNLTITLIKVGTSIFRIMIVQLARQRPHQGTPTSTSSPRCCPPTQAPTPVSPRMFSDRY